MPRELLLPPLLPFIPPNCRRLLAVMGAALLVNGCVHAPQEEDGNNAQAVADTASAAVQQTAADTDTDSSVTSSPESPVPSALPDAEKPTEAATQAPAPATDAAVTSPTLDRPDSVVDRSAGLFDERRGLGLALPPSGQLGSIEGSSRRWDVPDIPDTLKQDPYRASDQQGMASWYGGQFHGRKTANGERFNKEGFTAAHKTLPFGTQLCVRSMVTGKTVVVRINDRGPYSGDRIIDLSQGAAQELGMLGLGIKPVELWALDDDADRCPSFVTAAGRSGGRLAAPAGRGKSAVARDKNTGRVKATVPAMASKPARAKMSAQKRR
jgi:rare lipoprotein A